MCASVNPSVELRPNPGSDSTWTWVAEDFAEGVLKTETFALRLKTTELFDEFKTFHDQARATNSGAAAVSSASSSASSSAASAASASPADAAGPVSKRDRLLESAERANNFWFQFLSDASSRGLSAEAIQALWTQYDADKSGFLDKSGARPIGLFFVRGRGVSSEWRLFFYVR